MINYPDIESVHLEISTRCNAACPLCPRNTAGYDEELGYPIHSMSLAEAKRIFSPVLLRQLKKILINGNFGDFIAAPEGYDIVEYFVTANPAIIINICTNGAANPKIWAMLGKIPNVIVGFAIDGLKDTHSLYRKNTNWDTVISNAANFIGAGGRARWRMIRFDHNYHQIEACRQMSREMGFIDFKILDDGRDSGPVYDRRGKYSYKLGNDPAFRESGYPGRIEIWKDWSHSGGTPQLRNQEYKKIPVKSSVDCQAKKSKEIYVTATGEIYPCCWLGMYPKLEHKHPWQQDNHQIKEIVANNNALEVGIENAIAWFNAVEESWNKKAYHEGRLFKCDAQCGVSQQSDHKSLSSF